MNDRVDLRFVEQSANRIAIAQIRFAQRKFLAGNFANAVQRVGFGIDEIIQNDHLVPRIQQLHARMASDKARAARDQYLHIAHPFIIFLFLL